MESSDEKKKAYASDFLVNFFFSAEKNGVFLVRLSSYLNDKEEVFYGHCIYIVVSRYCFYLN